MNALADSPQSLILGLEILANDLYDILCGVAHHDTNTRIGLRRKHILLAPSSLHYPSSFFFSSS